MQGKKATNKRKNGIREALNPPAVAPARGVAHPWPPEAREAGINAYLATGSYRAASAATGIPVPTLHLWMRDPANEHVLDEARRIHARAAAVDAQAVWRQATAHVAEALENGDWRVSPKGDAIRLPVSAKDAAYIASIMADKGKQWGELAFGGQAPAELSPERAEHLAREILRIDRELERRQTVDITPAEQAQEPTQRHQNTHRAQPVTTAASAADSSSSDVGGAGDDDGRQ
jgi:hypothetical protein